MELFHPTYNLVFGPLRSSSPAKQTQPHRTQIPWPSKLQVLHGTDGKKGHLTRDSRRRQSSGGVKKTQAVMRMKTGLSPEKIKKIIGN